MITAAELSAIPLFADLTPEQLAFLARAVEDIPLLPGEYAVHEGDERALFVVVDGRVDLTKEINGVDRVIGPRGPGEIYGEVPVMLSMNMPASCVAVEASRMIKVDVGTFFTLAATAPQVVARVGALAQGRMEGLKEIAAEKPTPDMVVVGPLVDPRVHELRTFLHRNRIAFETHDAPARSRRRARRRHPARRPHRAGDRARGRAAGGAVARRVRRGDRRRRTDGLTAAVNGAAEGLRTLVVEKFAPGGQAGTSTRIENYTGFPFGVSGDELASKALRQAGRLGAEIVVTRAVESVDPRTLSVTLDGGSQIGAKVVLLTSGVEWRHVPLAEIDRFVGNGVYYGAARSDSGLAHGKDVYIIGAGNSAGQAALFFSRFARRVTLVVRGESLAASMSQYLIDQIGSNRHVTVETRSEVVGAARAGGARADRGRRPAHGDRRDARGRGALRDDRRRRGDVLASRRGRARRARVRADRPGREAVRRVDARPGSRSRSRPPCRACSRRATSGRGRSSGWSSGVGEGGMAIAFVHQLLALG